MNDQNGCHTCIHIEIVIEGVRVSFNACIDGKVKLHDVVTKKKEIILLFLRLIYSKLHAGRSFSFVTKQDYSASIFSEA